MARFDAWLEMQLRTVDDGAVCSQVILEGPDGTPWGTWLRSFPSMDASIEGLLASYSRELPRGKHACKLVAVSADKTQLGVFPMTISGASQEATESVQTQLTQQRSNALFIANAERSQKGLETMLTRTAELAEQICRANATLSQQLEELRASTSKERQETMREEGRQERLNAMTEKLGPLLDLAGGLISEWAATWLDERAKARSTPKVTSAQPSAAAVIAPVPAERLDSNSDSLPLAVLSTDETAVSEPSESRPSRRIDEPLVARSDGRGRGTGAGAAHVSADFGTNKVRAKSGRK